MIMICINRDQIAVPGRQHPGRAKVAPKHDWSNGQSSTVMHSGRF